VRSSSRRAWQRRLLATTVLALAGCSSSGKPGETVITVDPNIPTSDQRTFEPTQDPPPRYDPPVQSAAKHAEAPRGEPEAADAGME
jgi:hypothetical protein